MNAILVILPARPALVHKHWTVRLVLQVQVLTQVVV